MTRLNSAPQAKLAPDVYEASLKPLEYLGIDEVPSYEEVDAALSRQENAVHGNERLVIVPPSLEELKLTDWDCLLRESFKRNRAAREAGAGIPTLNIANLIIHDTFTRREPNFSPKDPTIAASVSPSEMGIKDQALTLAAYLIYQIGVFMEGAVPGEAFGKKTVLNTVEPTLFETETFHPLGERTVMLRKINPRTKEITYEPKVLKGDREVRGEYDSQARQPRSVVPLAVITSLKGQDALDVAEPILQAYRWAETVEKRMAPATPEGQARLEEWIGRFPTNGIEEVRVNPGHVGIAVLPRTARGMPQK